LIERCIRIAEVVGLTPIVSTTTWLALNPNLPVIPAKAGTQSNRYSSYELVNQIKQVLPFAIKQIQTDNGSEFSEPGEYLAEKLQNYMLASAVITPLKSVQQAG
jgi:hypothetical protein